MEVTEGHLLGGRVRYRQPKDGYRTGIEPVLLAAAVPARAGETVLEAGCGAGAGLLCLLARVMGLGATGVEIDADMAELARGNLAANGMVGEIVTADVLSAALPLADHVLANPPWHDSRSTSSAVGRRRLAKQATDAGIEGWIVALARLVGEGGTLTLVQPASQAEASEAALGRAGLGGVLTLPLLTKMGRAAKLVLLQARRGPAEAKRLPGLVLHREDGRYTEAIEAVLRGGGALVMAG